MQDLNDMFYFTQVIEQGGFSAAARALAMPKSTLSRRLSELEARLDVRLIHRTTRKLVLTDIGRVYLSHCQAMLAAAEAADAAVQQVHAEPRGEVRVSCPISISQTILARAVPEFMARYPKVSLMLEPTNRRVDLLEEGFDVAIRVRQKLEDSSLVLRHFALSTVVLVASPELLQQHGVPGHPSELARLPTLSMRYADGRHQFLLHSKEGEAISVSHRPRLITDDMWVLREAATSGLGIVQLPVFVCHEYLADGRLQVILPQWQLPQGQIHAVYPYRKGLMPAVRHFVDFLAERVPALSEEFGVSRFCPEHQPAKEG